MKSADSGRPLSGGLTTFAIFSQAALLLGGLMLLPYQTLAQQPNASAPAAQAGMARASALGAPIAELVKEAERNNPEIAAAYHGWQAATHVPKQAAAFPETQLSVQQFSVGSPRPFAGFSNSDFAYIGIGASQDLLYPGKRALRGKVAEFDASSMRMPTQCAGAWSKR
jgi:outer membrane protein TolC